LHLTVSHDLVETVNDSLNSGSINLFTAGDNLRKGAALNAVQIAELVCSSTR
jgi:aspartate-semialdehyde dehydrogenase